MSLEIRTGDLFASTDSLAHCVSADLAMGKGIAKVFRDTFGRVDELRSQRAGVGKVAWLREDTGGVTRYVYYLVTKQRFFEKPTLDTLAQALIDLGEVCKTHGVTRVAMPRIGCGLDRLAWDDVCALVTRHLIDDAGLYVTVYVLP